MHIGVELFKLCDIKQHNSNKVFTYKNSDFEFLTSFTTWSLDFNAYQVIPNFKIVSIIISLEVNKNTLL